MFIGNPVPILVNGPGSNITTPIRIASDSGVASGSPITTTVDAPAGSLIVVVAYAWASDDALITGVTDNAGNTYTQAVQPPAAVGVFNAAIFYCQNTPHDLPVGGHITVTMASGTYAADVYVVQNANNGVGPIDFNNTTSDVTGVTLSTGALSEAPAIVFGALNFSTSLGTITHPNFTSLSSNEEVDYLITTTTDAVIYSPSWVTSQQVSSVLATFYGIPGAVVSSGTPMTTIADAPAKSLIAVYVYGVSGGSPSSVTLTDSAGNTYQQAIVDSGNQVAIYFSSGTSDLPSGGTITPTFTGGGTLRFYAVAISDATGGLDKTASYSGSDTSHTLSTGALTYSNEIVLGIANSSGNVSTSNLTNIGTTISTDHVDASYKVVNSQASQSYTVTATSGINMALATFSKTPGGLSISGASVADVSPINGSTFTVLLSSDGTVGAAFGSASGGDDSLYLFSPNIVMESAVGGTAIASFTTSSITFDVPVNLSGTVTLSNSTAHGVVIGEGSGSPLVTTAAMSAGQILIGQGTSADPLPVSVSGNVTLSSGGVVTITTVPSGALTSVPAANLTGQISSLTHLPNISANSILGNNTAGSTTPSALTGAQVTAMLSTFTTSLQGLVPSSGGGTTNFLRADGGFHPSFTAASSAQVEAGTDNTNPITSSALSGAMAASLGSNGHQQLPNGWMIQWGTVSNATTTGTAVSFPTSFPTAAFAALACPIWGASGPPNATVSGLGTTGMTVFTSATVSCFWVAIGH